MNLFMPIFKKSYHYQFFIYFQVIKPKFLHEIISLVIFLFLMQKLYIIKTKITKFEIFCHLE